MRKTTMALPLTLAVALVALSSAHASAAPASYGVLPNASLVKFESEAPIENITGISTEASGTLTVDKDAPAGATGTVAIPVASLRTGNTTRDGHLQGADWLDAEKHPRIVFEITSVRLEGAGPLVDGAAARKGTATGELTIKGTTRTIEAPIEVQYLASSERLRKARINGDVVRVKATFDVTLADYGVKAPDHIANLKVADTVSVTATLTAATGAE